MLGKLLSVPKLYRLLRDNQVLGMNRRNLELIAKYNKRRYYPLVDDKLQTKRVCLEHGVPVPPLIGTINHYYQLNALPEIIADHHSLVIKPCSGAGGEGVLVFKKQRRDRSGALAFQEMNGNWRSITEIRQHVSNILAGIYSLGGQQDKAIIERRIIFDEALSSISYQGVPDLRVIVLLGFPIMAMTRLPTKQSGGKANLHQGGVGVGIDIASGRTLEGVQANSIVLEHPDTEVTLKGIEIPYWHEILVMASKLYEITKLGYVGADIVLDKELGPLLLEANARPGLNIQLANKIGLYGRVKAIEALGEEKRKKLPEERVMLCKELFTKS